MKIRNKVVLKIKRKNFDSKVLFSLKLRISSRNEESCSEIILNQNDKSICCVKLEHHLDCIFVSKNNDCSF